MLERFFRTTSVSLERRMQISMSTCGEENAVALSAGSAPGRRRHAARGAEPPDEVAGVLVVTGRWARRSAQGRRKTLPLRVRPAYRPAHDSPPRGATAMSDKSPHDVHSAKKSGKSIKAKRAEHKEKQQTTAAVERLLHPRKAPRS